MGKKRRNHSPEFKAKVAPAAIKGDQIHMAKPFLGSRRIVDTLADQGHLVNRKRVSRLMKLMGIQAIHPGPNHPA